MKKKLIAAILTGAMLAAGMTTSVWADGGKSFVYGTTGYSEEMAMSIKKRPFPIPTSI